LKDNEAISQMKSIFGISEENSTLFSSQSKESNEIQEPVEKPLKYQQVANFFSKKSTPDEPVKDMEVNDISTTLQIEQAVRDSKKTGNV
jgi:hypothetical protein